MEPVQQPKVDQPAPKTEGNDASAQPAKPKKKLSLEIEDVSETMTRLERKISP